MSLNNTTSTEDREIDILESAKNLNLSEILDIIKRLDEELTLSQNNHKDTTSDLEEANGKVENLEELLETAKGTTSDLQEQIAALQDEIRDLKNQI